MPPHAGEFAEIRTIMSVNLRVVLQGYSGDVSIGNYISSQASGHQKLMEMD